MFSPFISHSALCGHHLTEVSDVPYVSIKCKTDIVIWQCSGTKDRQRCGVNPKFITHPCGLFLYNYSNVRGTSICDMSLVDTLTCCWV